MSGWRLDPFVWLPAFAALVLYTVAIRRRAHVARARAPWARGRTFAYATGVLTALVAIESPLDRAGDAAFAPHMLQHLLLTDLVAPLVLLGAPLPLLLAALDTRRARAVVRALRSRPAAILTFPVFTWTLFIAALWTAHVGPLFELALDDERAHVAEHAIFLSTALLFWLPVVALPPTPWTSGPLAYPLRALYVFLAMPAEAFLGFAIYGTPRVIYPHYLAAGLADQRAAGELMWIGSGLAMLVAFLFVAVQWGVAERKAGRQSDARLDRLAALGAATSGPAPPPHASASRSAACRRPSCP